MSTFENFNQASRVYDDERVAVGADVMAAMLQFYSGKRLQDLHILDAGCGTGNYAKAMLEMGVGHVTLSDASTGMLEKATGKLQDYIDNGRIKRVIEAKMAPIPFPDKTFDCVMFNTVLLHLDRDDPDFPNRVATLKESVRILRPDGLIIISTVLPDVVAKSIWWMQLNMEITNRFNASILASSEQFDKMFENAGIQCLQKLNILGSDMFKSYHNIDSPLDEHWLSTASYWTFATEEETAVVIDKVNTLKAKGEYESWVKEHDHSDSFGMLTLFFCKPLPARKI